MKCKKQQQAETESCRTRRVFLQLLVTKALKHLQTRARCVFYSGMNNIGANWDRYLNGRQFALIDDYQLSLNDYKPGKKFYKLRKIQQQQKSINFMKTVPICNLLNIYFASLNSLQKLEDTDLQQVRCGGARGGEEWGGHGDCTYHTGELTVHLQICPGNSFALLKQLGVK